MPLRLVPFAECYNLFMLNVVKLRVIMLSVVMLSVVMLSVVMLSVIMPNAVMLSLNMLSVIMLNVVTPTSTVEETVVLQYMTQKDSNWTKVGLVFPSFKNYLASDIEAQLFQMAKFHICHRNLKWVC